MISTAEAENISYSKECDLSLENVGAPVIIVAISSRARSDSMFI